MILNTGRAQCARTPIHATRRPDAVLEAEVFNGAQQLVGERDEFAGHAVGVDGHIGDIIVACEAWPQLP